MSLYMQKHPLGLKWGGTGVGEGFQSDKATSFRFMPCSKAFSPSFLNSLLVSFMMRAYFLSFYAYYLQGGSRGNTGTWICGRLCSPKELEGCTCRCWGREPACRLPTRMLARAPTRHLGMVGSLPLMESASRLRPPSPLPPTPPGKIPISSWYCKLHPSINWPVHGIQKSQYRRCGCGLLVQASSCTRRIYTYEYLFKSSEKYWKISRSRSWITKDTTTSPQTPSHDDMLRSPYLEVGRPEEPPKSKAANLPRHHKTIRWRLPLENVAFES